MSDRTTCPFTFEAETLEIRILSVGLVVENEGDLAADGSKYETVQVSLHLIDERHPLKNLIHVGSENLPVLPSYYAESTVQGGQEPVYVQAADSKRPHLPQIRSSRPPAIRTPVRECFHFCVD